MVVFLEDVVQDLQHVVVDRVLGVASEDEVDVVEVGDFDLVDAVACFFRELAVQIPSILKNLVKVKTSSAC